MKKSILIPIVIGSLLLILAGASVGLVYAFSPSNDSELTVVSVTTQSTTDTVNVILKCEENTTGQHHQYQFRRNFAYMHQFKLMNATTGEELYQEQFQHQWQHRLQLGQTFSFQFQYEGLEHGQQLQLRIYYNGQYVDEVFTVNT